MVLYPTARAAQRLPQLQAAQPRASPCHRAHCSQPLVGVQTMDPQPSRQLAAATHTQQACAAPHATTQRLRCWIAQHLRTQRALLRRRLSQPLVVVQPVDPQPRRQLAAAISSPSVAAAGATSQMVHAARRRRSGGARSRSSGPPPRVASTTPPPPPSPPSSAPTPPPAPPLPPPATQVL